MDNIAALIISLKNSRSIRIYLDGYISSVDWKNEDKCEELKEGVKGVPWDPNEKSENTGLSVAEGLDQKKIIRITETKRYRLKVFYNDKNINLLPEIQNEDININYSRDENSMSFQFVNFLGRSKMTLDGEEVPFEVVPDKFDYEEDYVKLTEEIARNCAALLLDHTGSTNFTFEQGIANNRSIFEQFIFLRQFCYADNLLLLFESIKSNPDRVLISENVYKPMGLGIPSKNFYTHPFSNGKTWTHISKEPNGFALPQEIAVTRKFDSYDTPANRLIKFALERFDYICEQLLFYANGSQVAECIREADSIHQLVSSILHDRFFDDVGELDILPQNNQVLLKREGYSQLFAAFLMTDLALHLNWKGYEDVYVGESKNVALLYEYWLFFVLFDIVNGLANNNPNENEDTESKKFFDDSHGLTISLCQGVESCQSFILRDYGVKINLYYNRTFYRGEFEKTGFEGSYSRPFRPDFTLAIFPYDINTENEAIKNGTINFIHFDAKYRINEITDLIGKSEDIKNSRRTKEMDKLALEKEFEQEKRDSITNTYKRGDLLKMHTYNDAIRRTVGSYVLYPGSRDDENSRFGLFEEILPGVGAFAIRPSIQEESKKVISDFILDFIATKTLYSSRLSRLIHYREMIVNEPGREEKAIKSNAKDSKCIIGYLRSQKENDYYDVVVSKRLAKGQEFIYYFYAIKDGHVYSHHKDVFKTSRIRFYTNNVSGDGFYRLEPFTCKVIANELVSKAKLVECLNNDYNFNTSEEEHHADYYFVLKVEVEDIMADPEELPVSEVNSSNGNDTYSVHSPKIIDLSMFAVN